MNSETLITDALDGIRACRPIQSHGAALILIGLCVHGHLKKQNENIETLLDCTVDGVTAKLYT